MCRSARVAALLVLLVLLAVSGRTSSAHETDPAVVTLLDSVTPPLPEGVRVEVAAGLAAQLVVENSTVTPFEALAPSGEVFVRVSSAGVAANLASPSWFDSLVPGGRSRGTSRPAGPDRFARVQSAPTWGWFDHRLHPSDVTVTPRVRAAKRTARLGEWTVPMRYGDLDVVLRGHLEFRPILGRIVADIVSTRLPQGVELAVVDGRLPALFLRSTTSGPVRVFGGEGEVFAEVRPDRVVVNPRSRVHIEDARSRGVEPRLAPAGGGFVFVSSAPSYTWLDPRLRYTEPAVPDDVQRRHSATVLTHWAIPIEVGNERFMVEGTTAFEPFDLRGVPFEGPDDPGGVGSGRLLAAVTAPALLLLAVALLRRRATYDRVHGKG